MGVNADSDVYLKLRDHLSVPGVGVEPTRPFGQRCLRPPRLTDSATRAPAFGEPEVRVHRQGTELSHVHRDSPVPDTTPFQPGPRFGKVHGMPSDADLRLRVWLDARPAPVVSRPEAIALGFTDRMIQRRLETGWWNRLGRGLYAVAAEHVEWRSTLSAATTKLPAVVSHHSAAQVHAFPMTPRGKLVVTVPHRTTHTFPGVEVCQSTDLTEEYVTVVDGLPVTTVTRTVFDIAHFHRIRFLTALIEKLIVAHQVDIDELASVLGQLGRRGRPGTVKTRAALAAIMPTVERLESELELVVLDLIRDAGLPVPLLQHPLPWRTSKPGRVDMAYPEARLIIECDGRLWHIAAKAFEDDRRRDNLATTAGWRVIRVTWKMAVDEPDEVVRLIASALGKAQTG